ncbi:AAEL000726-PA [Aedes aegypti]|uniref:AAEL000726-PA n=2 Tax=Aedes aegypti TaxID=7159 RepID=A0A1S4EWT0_AEDAE|nr:fibrinogen-like protein A [Aedes aegypti]EAT48215.1 AAEL000726-PA [Aedes aegypti]
MNRQLWIIIFAILCVAQAEEDNPTTEKMEELGIATINNFTREFYSYVEAVSQVLADLELTTTASITQIKHRIKHLLQEKCNLCSAKAEGPALDQGYVTTSNGSVIPVSYEQTRFGGGWIVLMQRYDGTVRFNRSWAEYRDGFGMVGHEFWLGLERIHQMTKDAEYELMIEMQDFEGNYKYAGYDAFAVGPEEERYPLAKVGKFNKTAYVDSFGKHRGYGFSTYDNDDNGCSNQYGRGGWWYYRKSCFGASLTGIWQNKQDWKSISWVWFSTEKKQVPLKFARMMMRLKTAE